jgi:hypothetical protein
VLCCDGPQILGASVIERDVAEDSAAMADRLTLLALIAVYFGVITMTPNQAASADRDPDRRPPVFYRSITVDGLSIFYREAGRPEHRRFCCCTDFRRLRGCTSRSSPGSRGSSTWWRRTYPGFGHSDAPGAKDFTYTFDHLADVMEHFTESLGLKHYALYLQDYGGPVGFRLALAHPERQTASCRASIKDRPILGPYPGWLVDESAPTCPDLYGRSRH